MTKDRRPWPSEIARDVDEEIASHLDLRREEYATQGMDPAAAQVAAARKFGNRDDVAEACRLIDRRVRDQERRTSMWTDLGQDLGYALRMFRRSPGFAAVAIATLAIGMGATTTIFTLANWALLRPVPGVADPANVSVIWVGQTRERGSFTVGRLSYPNLADAIARLRTISIGAYQGGEVAAAGGGQAARNVGTQYVTASYFDVLGVRMQVGRPFTAAEDTPPSPFLGAVISDRLWQSMFHRDPNVLQQPLELAGVRFAILGVAPPAFHGTERLSMTDLWLPGSSYPIVRHMPTLRYDARSRGGFYELVARLEPGATWPQAQAELETFRAWLREEYPQDNANFRSSGFRLMGPIGPPPLARDMMKRIVGLTAGAASALVLLIACANVAGLLMVRGIERRSEIAVRKALGAGRWRLLRQHMAEGMLLWMLGGAAALGIVLLLGRTVNLAALLGMGVAADMTPPIDWRVLAFTGLVSLVVGLLFSVGPAVRVTRAEAAETLRSTVPTATRRMFVGTSLAVFQLSASLTLLVGAFLLVGTLRHLARVPLGFDPDGVFVFEVRPTSIGYGEAASLEYLDEFQRRLSQIGGVRRVAAADGAPFHGGSNFHTRVRRADAARDTIPIEARLNFLFSPAYFETLGIPLVKGRAFVETDFSSARRGESRVVMLSDGLSRRLFADADPIGREIDCPARAAGPRCQVIGIVGTARYHSLVAAPDDAVFEPAPPRRISSGATIIVRTSGSVALAEEARGIAAALNAALPLAAVLSMADAVGRSRREWDSLARLLGILAVLAAVLACVGLYSVVAHGVAQRRREFGIRIALGASRAEVWRLVLRQTAAITAAGLAFGLAGGVGLAQVLRSRLVGVDAFDPLLWSLAAGALVLVAALASLIPAFAATRVDVTETLRAI